MGDDRSQQKVAMMCLNMDLCPFYSIRPIHYALDNGKRNLFKAVRKVGTQTTTNRLRVRSNRDLLLYRECVASLSVIQ